MDDTNDRSNEGSEEVTNYKLNLEGPGLKVERALTEVQAFEVLAVLMGGAVGLGADTPPARASREAAVARTRGTAGRGLSLREYFDEAEPKRNPDKILVVASYLKAIEGVEAFSPDDVKGRFRSAGETVPGNWARDFRWVVQNGWVAEDQGSGDYYVTKKGEDAVANKFSAEVKKATAVKQRSRRRAKKSDHAS